MIKVLIPQALLENLREFLYNHQNVAFDFYNSNFVEKLKEENWDIIFFENPEVSFPGKIVVNTIKELELAVTMFEERLKYEAIKKKYDMLFSFPELQGPEIRKFLELVIEKNKFAKEIVLQYENGIIIEEYYKFFSHTLPFTKIKFSKKHGIKIPPLRKRKNDIPYILDKILSSIYAKHRNLIKRIPDENEIDLLKEYNWPGNTKELITIAYNYASTGLIKIPNKNNTNFNGIDLPKLISHLTKQVEKRYIKLALKNSKSRKEACKLLNMNYKTLSHKIKLYRLDEK
ncbi:AAA-type ATPase lid domain-containing protein [Thermosipho atlanticus]|uniref:Regulatory protein, Fis family n=1 Tax=Thermosipho atlanticus DSM 15807 TaxID=1123380 RepID=A0A1M5SHU2_9BACT|nr:helix-turn-helix domain-containing protein [Thermosipho atlanticus]SHH38106.1 regulatory protein, Fis family [Thermosipho atlanticus DSM 15807]